MRYVIVVDKPEEWRFTKHAHMDIVSAKSYLAEQTYLDQQSVRVFNLCRSHRYQSIGYYVSLIAQARGQKIIPSVSTIQDLNSQTLIKTFCEEMNELIQKSLSRIKSEEFTLSIYFGKNMSAHYEKLCRKLTSIFQAPLLRAQFYYDKYWRLKSIKSISLSDIPESHYEYAKEFAEEYFAKKRFNNKEKTPALYSLAILVNPKEETPPSDKKAIKNFIEAAEHLDFNVELITKDDYNRIPEFDALFIRETTAVNHHTYRFARRAVAEGLVVIDDPDSILKCANKVYLTELLQKARIDIPKSIVVQRSNSHRIAEEMDFPCVLKIPDGAFSKGVLKAKNKEELENLLKELFDKSDLILAQEYTPSEFDWRIGIINKKVIFASKYYMAKGHWQILNWAGQGKKEQEGDDESLPIKDIPEKVMKTALRAANLIGDGFYGVDLKQVNNRIMVIEINDNPSIDANIEDRAVGESLYHEVIKTILQRIHERKSKAEKLL